VTPAEPGTLLPERQVEERHANQRDLRVLLLFPKCVFERAGFYNNLGNGALRSRLEHHVEWPGSRLADLVESTLANDFGELGLTRLRAQAFADFLIQ
jgi:hypothetical protein